MFTNIIDIHSHIMPGVDDGATDISMTKAMMHIAYEEGIGSIILTPHYKTGHRHAKVEIIRKCAEELTAYSEYIHIPMKFYPGNELMFYSGAVDRLNEGRICTMADSRYVLVEFNPLDPFDYIMNGLRELSYAGYNPILAHIERYDCIVKDKYAYEYVANMGVCIQVNAGSVMGKFGGQAKNYTRMLLKEQAVQFVATDAHSDEGRAPLMQDVSEFLTRKCGEQYAHELLEGNAHKLLEDKEIL